MTDNTPTYGFPFPENTDPPDGPAQFEALALAVEGELERIDDDITRIDTAPSILVYTSSDTLAEATVSGAKALRVKCVGGGGSGGGAEATGAGESSAGAGGQGGHYAESVVAIGSVSFPVTITVGAGGTGASGATGTAGGTSSFGALVSAGGGDFGEILPTDSVAGASVPGGENAMASMTGDIQIQGDDGDIAWRFEATRASPGDGGASHMSGSRAPRFLGGNQAARDGLAYGGGGTGASRGPSVGALVGGNGADGVVIVEPIY